MGEVTRLAPRAPETFLPQRLEYLRQMLDCSFAELDDDERGFWEQTAREIAARRPFGERERYQLTLELILSRAVDALLAALEFARAGPDEPWIDELVKRLQRHKAETWHELGMLGTITIGELLDKMGI